MIKDRVCYVCCFYFGDRRKINQIYNIDRLILLKKQINYLNRVKHNIDNIVFSFNLNYDDINILNEFINLIPKKIHNSNVEIVIRQNNGISYAAWSEYAIKNIEKYDYFIFNEDDYFFIEDNFDDYLISTFKNYERCGYLCLVAREPMGWNGFRKHAGASSGITDKKSLGKVFNYFETFSKIKGYDYKIAESLQIDFTNCFMKEGLEIYDVRENYRIPFSTTVENEPDVMYYFNYNEKDLIIPLIVDMNNFTWSTADLDEFKKYQ